MSFGQVAGTTKRLALALLALAAAGAAAAGAVSQCADGHGAGPLARRAFAPGLANDTAPAGNSMKVAPPATGVYHAAFADFGGSEDIVTPARIEDFETLAGRKVVWSYFSDNWTGEIRFPAADVAAAHDAGTIPFIRMMPRSTLDGDVPDPVYSMQSVLDGKFDTQLTQWAAAARAVGYPLMVEFGTEVNGDWFPWNGRYNGGANGGPTRFRDAYRHIIDLFREQAVANITWVFHVDAQASPEASWNAMRNYYPGDDYIDWLGISAYGPQRTDEDWQEMTDVLDAGYAELAALSASKPIALLEFGVTENYPGHDKAAWLRNALAAIQSQRYPRIKAVSYWHENYRDDDGTNVRLRIDTSPAALAAYKEAVASPFFGAAATFASGAR